MKVGFNFMKISFNFMKGGFNFMKQGFNLANRPRAAAAKEPPTVPRCGKSGPKRPENSEYSGFMPRSIRGIQVLCLASQALSP